MSEEELEEALDEIFKEDIEMIRERMKVLMRSYDKALDGLVGKDKIIKKMAIDISKDHTYAGVEEIINYYYKEVEKDD